MTPTSPPAISRIGSRTTRSNWLYNAVLPAIVVSVETTWASLLLFALFRLDHGAHEDVPFLALAFPAVLAVICRNVVRSRLGEDGGAARAVFCGSLAISWLLAAGCYLAVVLDLPALDVLRPWAVAGSASTQTNFVLSVTGIACLRGAWVARSELRQRAIATSVGVGAVVFALILCIAAFHHGQYFYEQLARDATTLLLFALPGAVAAVALVYERSLEQRAEEKNLAAPHFGWLVAVALPTVIVGLLALLVVAVLDPIAPPVGHLLQSAGRGIGGWILDVARWVSRFVPRLHVHEKLPQKAAQTHVGSKRPVRVTPPGPAPTWVKALFITLGALVAMVLGLLLARLLYNRRPRRVRVEETPAVAETSESLFSFGHLLSQLRNAAKRRLELGLQRLASASRRNDPTPATSPPASVREHYRHFLVALTQTSQQRSAAETPLELAARLEEHLDVSAVGALNPLTDLYDGVRYGDVPDDSAATEEAAVLVAGIVSALAAVAEEGAPSS